MTDGCYLHFTGKHCFDMACTGYQHIAKFKKKIASSSDYEVVEERKELNIDTLLCQVCQISFDDDKLLICDKWNSGIHTYCNEPEVKEIPEDEWFCYDCLNADN
jgi:hypothetical protein